MSNEGPGDQQDLPWNDAPADSEAPVGSNEPDPAEIVEDEDGEHTRDLSAHVEADPYQRDTLDQRLREEEPDLASGRRPDAAAGALLDPGGGGDVQLEETDEDDSPDEASAEDAAMHIVDEDRVL